MPKVTTAKAVGFARSLSSPYIGESFTKLRLEVERIAAYQQLDTAYEMRMYFATLHQIVGITDTLRKSELLRDAAALFRHKTSQSAKLANRMASTRSARVHSYAL